MEDCIDWKAIKTEYITTNTSYRKLSAKYGVGYQAICHRSQEEGWIELREQYTNDTVSKTLDKIGNQQSARYARLMTATDRLLAKVEKAIEELDITLATDTKKTKEIEYDNDRRPDKPTKETVTEETTIRQVVTIVDRSGLKAISSALRDIKEVQMLKTELDQQEQRARIANLRKSAEAEENADKEIVVTIAGDLEEYSR